jgi:hypothetical protein
MIYKILITYLLIGVILFILLDTLLKNFAEEKDQYSFKMGLFIIFLWPFVVYGFYKLGDEEENNNKN